MNQQNIQRTPIRVLNIALVLQILYVAGIFWIVMDPAFFLRAAGYIGEYDMPFDSIHFIGALLSTVIFVVMYTLLMMNMKKQKQMGLGTGIFLGVLSYMSYFLMTSVVSKLAMQRVELLSKDVERIAVWSMSWEENVVAYMLIANWYGYVRLALKTAIVLLLVAYGIYCYRKKEQNMPQKLYK